MHHVGDCYKHLGLVEDAISNYKNAVEVYKPYAMNGWPNPYIDDTYNSYIELLKQTGQTEEASRVEQERELVKSRRQRG